MKIYAICVEKNEADIIQYTLKRALEWADKIIVYDNGSTDGTWEIVKGFNNSKIVPFRHDNRPYSDGLRAEIFNAFKHELADGDWWVILDGDEEYEQNPRQFIQNQKSYFHHINGRKIDFCFDLMKIDELLFIGNFESDRHLFNFYTPEVWSEPRAIKHRRKLQWRVEKIWPTTLGLVCSQTIPIRHYPLRSPNQIKKRWSTRRDIRERGGQSFNHWEKDDWKEYYSAKLKTLKPVDTIENVFNRTPFMNEFRQSPIKRLVKFTLHKLGILP